MRRLWQKLILILIILSCGIIFSLGSSARDTVPEKARGGRGQAAGGEMAATAPAKVVVYYAQDRHGPW